MRIVLIDGPFRGQVVDTPNPRAYVIQMPVPVSLVVPADFASDLAYESVAFNQVVYRISCVRLFGELLLAGSVRYPPSDRDAFDALASDLAKDAVRG